MLYFVGQLFSKVDHIELSALSVSFKDFIAKKNYTAIEDVSFRYGNYSSGLTLAKLAFPVNLFLQFVHFMFK